MQSVEDGGNTINLKHGWKMVIDHCVFRGVEDEMCGRWGDTIYLKRGWKMGIDYVLGGVADTKCGK